jgi:uncharacterized protein involved in exopolysaccharide biosynthesis
MNSLRRAIRWLFTKENIFALILCLILVAGVIMTADTSPQWIYQGF